MCRDEKKRESGVDDCNLLCVLPLLLQQDDDDDDDDLAASSSTGSCNEGTTC